MFWPSDGSLQSDASDKRVLHVWHAHVGGPVCLAMPRMGEPKAVRENCSGRDDVVDGGVNDGQGDV